MQTTVRHKHYATRNPQFSIFFKVNSLKLMKPCWKYDKSWNLVKYHQPSQMKMQNNKGNLYCRTNEVVVDRNNEEVVDKYNWQEDALCYRWRVLYRWNTTDIMSYQMYYLQLLMVYLRWIPSIEQQNLSKIFLEPSNRS